MVDDLKQAVALAQRRPDEEQRLLAHVLLEAMQAEEHWRRLFDDSRSHHLLEELTAEALAEDDAGEAEEIASQAVAASPRAMP